VIFGFKLLKQKIKNKKIIHYNKVRRMLRTHLVTHIYNTRMITPSNFLIDLTDNRLHKWKTFFFSKVIPIILITKKEKNIVTILCSFH